MVVARLHTKMFEATARELDRQIRLQFLDGTLRPDYLKDYEGRLNGTNHFAEQGAAVGGRMLWAKKIFRRLLRPYLEHQVALNRMLIERLSELHQDFAKLAGEAEELRTTLTEDLDRRIDLIRDELATEVRRLDAVATGAPIEPHTQPIPAGSKVVLGTLAAKRLGHVHVDPSIEGTAPLDRLPVEPGTLAEITVANVLERYTASEVRSRLLPYWATLLRPGGRLSIIADDLGAAADRFRDGQLDFEELTGLILGQGDTVRRSAFTPEQLAQYAAEAGLSDVSVTERKQRPESGAYGFELIAQRASD